MVVDWSELPKELLNQISKCFDIELDLIRFRSICSTWRSSSIPNHHHILPFKFPRPKLALFEPATINTTTTRSCYFSKQTYFLIKPPPSQQQQQTQLRPWLIRISPNSSGKGKTQLLHPFLQCTPPLPFTHVLDFNKFFVLPLGSIFNWEGDGFTFEHNLNYIYPGKAVAVTCHGKPPLIFGILNCDPTLLLFNCGGHDENWKLIPMSIDFRMGDICLFKGQPYAANKFGRTITVGLEDDRSVQLVAEPLVSGGDMKFLVESEGDLLLADVYECRRLGFPGHDPVRINVFKLNEKEKKWVKLTSLGDRVLFLGLLCSFSVSASDLCVSKGNCVIFMNSIFRSAKYTDRSTCVLHLDQSWLSSLSDSPEYSKLFWPPPEWIVRS